MFRSQVILTISLFFVLSFLNASSSVSQDLEDHGKKVTLIEGDVFHACLSAYNEFSKELKEFSKNPSKTAQILSKLNNYDIKIFDKKNTYIVQFSLKVKKFPHIRGGGVEYLIDKINYRVTDIDHYR